MKKVIVFVIALILVLGMMACGNNKPAESADSTGSTETSSDASNIKVGLICDTAGLGDQSVNDQAQSGMDMIAERFGVHIETAEPTDESQFIDMIQKFCDLDFDLIVCSAFSMEDALTQIAPNEPDTSFMILDTIVDLPNVMSFTYATHEGSFLAGVAAAQKTESNILGFVGGMSIPTIHKFEGGYIEGAQFINPDIQVISKYIGTDGSAWNDPATAKSLTLDIIANGGDVSYHAAGGSGLGMIEACQESGIWAIGVNIDQSHIAPETVLTSMLTRGDVAIVLATEKLINGEFEGGHVLLNCANDGVGIVINDFFTQDEKDELESIRQKIISGEIVVTDASLS